MKRKIMIEVILLGFFLINTVEGGFQKNELIFEKGTVFLTVRDNILYTECKFDVKNYSKDNQYVIGFPFHIDKYLSSPSNINIFIEECKIDFKTIDEENIIFLLSLEHLASKTISIGYHQQIKKNQPIKITYITKTIRTWGHPLKSETFYIQVSNHYVLRNCTLPIRKIERSDHYKIYYIHVNDYFPDENLSFVLMKNFEEVIHFG